MPAFQEYFDPGHQLVRDSVRRFVEREILPDIDLALELASSRASPLPQLICVHHRIND